MSKNTDKITKALNAKNYQVTDIDWEPIGQAPIMCGPEGGWEIFFEPFEDMCWPEDSRNKSPIMEYNINDVMKWIEELSVCVEESEVEN